MWRLRSRQGTGRFSSKQQRIHFNMQRQWALITWLVRRGSVRSPRTSPAPPFLKNERLAVNSKLRGSGEGEILDFQGSDAIGPDFSEKRQFAAKLVS